MGELIRKYLTKMDLNGNEVLSHLKANQLMNENVMSYYKNRVSLRDIREYTSNEIAEKLALIENDFTKQFEENWIKEFGKES